MRVRLSKYFVLLPLALLAPLLPAQQKYALVIGNGAYTGISPLKNPVNDARDMEAVLSGLGFVVDLVVDGTRGQMEAAVTGLKERLAAEKHSYGFLFYAGHGVQFNGENYLIPVEADLQSGNYLKERAVSVQVLLDELNDAGNELNIVVLDACRDNPFRWNRSTGRGLVMLNSQPADSIIVYATSAGSVAADGEGRNGFFTAHLLDNLKTPGLEVAEVFRRTGLAVSLASGRKQIPAVYNQFFGTAYLGAPPEGVVVPQVIPVPAAPPPVRLSPVSMVRIPGGTFNMGSNTGSNDETPVHGVTLRAFYMAAYPVTQKEWREVMGGSPGHFKGDTLPVENVSWYEAVEYCNKRSLLEGLNPVYQGSGDSISCDWNAGGYRLPTEAEWEYAGKGGNGTPGYYTHAGSNLIDRVAWYGGNSGGTTRPVGGKNPNGLGIYDMNGNVWEWCWDWYGSYGRNAQTDPRGASSGANRVIRGGSWDDAPASTATRRAYTPASRSSGLGLRLVRRSTP